MIQIRTKESAIPHRKLVKSGSDGEHWKTDFLLPNSSASEVGGFNPQAFLIEMTPGEVLLPHFHEAEQFQIFVDGSGKLARNQPVSRSVIVHYTDPYTGYGPITAGPHGFSYFALRPWRDPGAIYLHKPGYKERLKPSLKRHFQKEVQLSTEPVLGALPCPVVESLLTDCPQDYEGIQAILLRLGPNQSVRAPDASCSGGQFFVVLQGSCMVNSVETHRWTIGFVSPDESDVVVQTSVNGAEIVFLNFQTSMLTSLAASEH